MLHNCVSPAAGGWMNARFCFSYCAPDEEIADEDEEVSEEEEPAEDEEVSDEEETDERRMVARGRGQRGNGEEDEEEDEDEVTARRVRRVTKLPTVICRELAL